MKKRRVLQAILIGLSVVLLCGSIIAAPTKSAASVSVIETEEYRPPEENTAPEEQDLPEPAGGIEPADLPEPGGMPETALLFSRLAGYDLIASSGVGAWDGQLEVKADGSFTGDYYDADMDDVSEVSFSGTFGAVYQISETIYGMTVTEAATENEPGTHAETDYGYITYIDTLFPVGSKVIVTLPGTPDDDIPEMVRGEIGGTYLEWDDYSRFCTLTLEDSGWGFFAETDESETGENPAPVTAAPEPDPVTQAPEPGPVSPPPVSGPVGDTDGWIGYWMTQDNSRAEMIITDNGDGTLHMKAVFLYFQELEEDLKAQGTDSLVFEDNGGLLIGTLLRQQDGKLRMSVTADDDYYAESPFYEYISSRQFVYKAAHQEDIWYEESPELPESTEWLGSWTAENDGRESRLTITEDAQAGYTMQITFDGGYSFTAVLEPYDERSMDFYTDEFNCMLTMNRKQQAIILHEIGTTESEVSDWLDLFGYIAAYRRDETNPAAVPEITQTPEPEITPTPVPEITPTPEPVITPTPEPDPIQESTPAPAKLTPIAGKPGYMKVPVAYVTASECIIGKDPSAYLPSRMMDGDETTSYQFSTNTVRLGDAFLFFEFDGPSDVDELWIKNGFWKTTGGKDQYTRNSRVKKMTIHYIYDDANRGYPKSQTVTLKDDKARKDWTKVPLECGPGLRAIEIRINEIYKGSKFKTDVCISEIMFVQETDKHE